MFTHDGSPLILIERTRQILEKYGWRQGKWGPLHNAVDGPHCVEGAFIAATLALNSNMDSNIRARQALAEAINTQSRVPDGLILWNDRKWRTKKHVIKMLNDAETKLRQKGV